MESRAQDEEHEETECPCCRLRAAVTGAILDPDNDLRLQLLDQLLDTVESVRSFDTSSLGTEPAAASTVAVDVVRLVHMILDGSGEHLTVCQGEE